MNHYLKKSELIFILVLLLQGCAQNLGYLSFDNNMPDSIPKVFAENIFNQDSSYIGYCSFNPKGEDFFMQLQINNGVCRKY